MFSFDRACSRQLHLTSLFAIAMGAAVLVCSADVRAQGGTNSMSNMKEMSTPGAAKQATAAGTVTAVNAAGHKITLDHGPIAEINWPAMKMEFSVAPAVDLSKVKAGDRVQFTLSGSGSSYVVQSISRRQ